MRTETDATPYLLYWASFSSRARSSAVAPTDAPFLLPTTVLRRETPKTKHLKVFSVKFR